MTMSNKESSPGAQESSPSPLAFASDYIFGRMTAYNTCSDALRICEIFVDIYPDILLKGKDPLVSIALRDIVTSGHFCYSGTKCIETNADLQGRVFDHIKEQLFYIVDILPHVKAAIKED